MRIRGKSSLSCVHTAPYHIIYRPWGLVLQRVEMVMIVMVAEIEVKVEEMVAEVVLVEEGVTTVNTIKIL